MTKKIKKKETKIKIIISLFLITFITTTLYFVKEINKKEVHLKLATLNNTQIEFYRAQFPLRNWNVPSPTLRANGFLVASIKEGKEPKILFDKNRTQRLPIASITKLMTAIIVLEEYDLNEVIVISEEAFQKDITRPNNLYLGETYKVKDLLYSSLIESSNTAAHALAQRMSNLHQEPMSVSSFVNRMNQKAISLGMNNTWFINPTGLDPINVHEITSFSTPEDLLILAKYLLDNPKIMEILSIQSYNLKTSEGNLKYTMINTNELLGESGIIGGKTGQTFRARECLLMISQNPKTDEYLISIVLGSSDRFKETRELLNSAVEAFYWKEI